MKKISLIVCLIAFCICGIAQKLNFSTNVHDFSSIKEIDGIVEYEFKFVNKSPKAFIVSAQSKENNVRVLYSRDVLTKKAEGSIKVSYNPKGKAGDFNHDIVVIANEKGKEVTYNLTIKGYVEPRPKPITEIYGMKEGNLRYKTNSKQYSLTPNSLVTDTFCFYNEWTQKMTFSVKSLPAAIKVLYVTPELMPKGEGILVFQYNAAIKNDYGSVWDRFTMYTNDTERPNKTFYISGNLYDDFASWTPKQMANAPKISVSEEEYRFSPVNEGEDVEHTFVISNSGKSTLYLRKLKQSCSCTLVQPDTKELDPGESTNIKAIFRTQGKGGHQMRTIDVVSNDPQRPKITLKIVGQVNPKQK